MPQQPERKIPKIIALHVDALGRLTRDPQALIAGIGMLLVNQTPDHISESLAGHDIPAFDFRYSPSSSFHCECRLVSDFNTFVVVVHEGLLLFLRIVAEILSFSFEKRKFR
jgi:hypothetical protein